ncbi:blast:Protein arginine N-methyltransferase 8-B [Drosophila guanche]|uniref:Protein arginine N-methyltransferase 6 n=1 Tax=Drosophila guanche TaxID=7266 RepID=A0A3B0KPC8_DROGU|nr:blast:Protein arginine N-methyltransferase 8-B [Drosophila guanche]
MPSNNKVTKNVENNANGARKKTGEVSKATQGPANPANREHPNVPNKRDNENVPRTAFQAASKLKQRNTWHVPSELSRNHNELSEVQTKHSALEAAPKSAAPMTPSTWEREAAPGMYGNELDNDIYRGISELTTEPSRQRPQAGALAGGNRNIYNSASQWPPNNWRHSKPYVPPEAPMSMCKEYIGSEISQFFPVPPEHPILELSDGNTSRQRPEWKQNQPPNTWEREAAPGMYGNELKNDCYHEIYRGISELPPEPSRQRPLAGTLAGGNRNIYNSASQRASNNWGRPVPPEHPILELSDGKTSRQRPEWKQNQPPNTWEREAAPGMYGNELKNDCYHEIYRGISELPPEPSRQRPLAGTLAGGNRNIYNSASQRASNNWGRIEPYVPPEAMSKCKEYIGSEISQFFPVPPEHPILELSDGKTSRQRPDWKQNQPPNTWEREAAPEMYGNELKNDCYHEIYRGISELPPEPSSERPQAGTLAGGNRNIYNSASQRASNNWGRIEPYVPPEAMSKCKEYIGSEISQFFPVPPEHPILELSDGNTSRQRTEWNQKQGVATDIVFKNKWIVLAKAKESGRREVPIPWAQRVAEARREQKIQILKTPEPANAPLTTPARCVPKELQQVDRMTSADFRHDYAAHLQNMRMRLKDQEYVYYFEKVIRENAHLFKGRVILVLSCGVGTLALMAARYGEAKRVYAVDRSMVTNYAELVVKQNHYESTVKVLHGRVAELQLPEQVDGIVCNWMGQSLLWDSEILEVLEARDRWLKSDGFILPDLGDLYLLGSAEPGLKALSNWWYHLYGFNMSAMRQYALSEFRFAETKCERVLTLAHRVLKLDLMSATKEDLHVDREIRLKVIQDGYLECFTLYFDVTFSRCHRKRRFSCNPCFNKSHDSLWLQTALFVESPFVLRENLFYGGSFIFRPLKGQGFDLKQMEIIIKLFVSERPEGEMAECFGNRLVAKRWVMLDRYLTVAEVHSCQDAEY